MKSEILEIDSVAYGGCGVARRSNGKVCFIPHTLPGENVEVEIVAEKKRFSAGRLIRVLEASGHRLEPVCKYFAQDSCPGCAYMHCDYPFEITLKQQQLHDFLVRRSIIRASDLLPPFASAGRIGNRNKLVMNSHGNQRGYTGKELSFLPVDACLLAVPEINAFLAANEPQSPRETIRFTQIDGAVNAGMCGKKFLTENIPGAGNFKVAPNGFFQTNIAVAAELVKRSVEIIAASGLKHLVELYCGVGIFSIAAAEKIPDLAAVGIEYDQSAVSFAKINASDHQVASRCRFISGDAGKKISSLGSCREAVMVVDPPRAGISAETLKMILLAEPAKVIYISCAPDTLARDLEKFIAGGYIVRSSGLLDMFPGTAHFEVMTVLEKI